MHTEIDKGGNSVLNRRVDKLLESRLENDKVSNFVEESSFNFLT